MNVSSDEMEVAATKPFRFFDLPSELRLRVYELVLLVPKTVDLDPTNHRAISPRLRLFLVSRRMHDETFRVFYGRNTFRVFPVHGRFFHTKAPLLTRLSPRYRNMMTKLELRLGPGWNKPPKGWVADGRLGLIHAEKVRSLKVFVECDPASHEVFEGFRVGHSFYTEFCIDLLKNLTRQLLGLTDIEFDAYESVTKNPSPLLQGLVKEAKANNKQITYALEHNWDKIVEANLANALESLAIVGSSEARTWISPVWFGSGP